MSSHHRHEESEEHQGGTTTPRAPDSLLHVHPPIGQTNKADSAATSEGTQVQLGKHIRENHQAIEGFSNISISHPKIARLAHPGVFGGLGGGDQCHVGIGGRRQRTTDILR